MRFIKYAELRVSVLLPHKATTSHSTSNRFTPLRSCHGTNMHLARATHTALYQGNAKCWALQAICSWGLGAPGVPPGCVSHVRPMLLLLANPSGSNGQLPNERGVDPSPFSRRVVIVLLLLDEGVDLSKLAAKLNCKQLQNLQSQSAFCASISTSDCHHASFCLYTCTVIPVACGWI